MLKTRTKTMKKSFAISAAALAAFVMTGCNSGGSSSYTDTFPVRVSLEEATVGGNTVTTSWTYDKKTGLVNGETQKVGPVIVYEIADYTFEGNEFIRYRTSYGDGGLQQKMVSTLEYIYNGNYETKLEIFNMGPNGAGTTPVEVWDKDFDMRSDMIVPTLDKHTKNTENGVEVILHRYDYDYTSALSCTYKEIVNGGEPVTMTQTYSDSNFTNYEIKNADGDLVEKVSAYNVEDDTITYTLTRYDADRNVTVTNVTEKWDTISVTVEY